MEKLTLRTPELQGIEKSKAEQIKATFEPMVKMLEEFEESFNDILQQAHKGITEDVTKKAKRVRIDIGRVRIETEKLRKKQKEEYLRAGKAIDGVANILKWAVSDKENKLKEIEAYFEIQEQKRLEKLKSERVELLSKYIEDASERNLYNMDEDVWQAYFNAKKQAYEDKIEAEKKAEDERIAKEKAFAAEQERIRKENELLKKEAETEIKRLEAERIAREKETTQRLAKEEKERKEREAQAKKEREVYELRLKEEREAKERIEREERIKREKIEAELNAKKEAELKAIAKTEAKKQAELQRGDTEKMAAFVTDLKDLKTKYSFKSNKFTKKYNDASVLIDKIITFIK